MAYSYVISIGSNLHPEANVAKVLPTLLDISPELHVSRILETEPVGLEPGGFPFLNLVVTLRSSWTAEPLKAYFNAIESDHGRDRSDPLRGWKSRPIDLDILFPLTKPRQRDIHRLIPEEPFLRPLVLEMLHYLGIPTGLSLPPLPKGVTIQIEQAITVGCLPATLARGKNGTLLLI